MSNIDHKARAETALSFTDGIVRNHDGNTPEVTELLAKAQVHATLALVAAQQTANLIAYRETEGPSLELDLRIRNGLRQS